MIKTFKAYSLAWTICLVLFNIIAFVVPNSFKENFWLGYIFITVSFLGQLICSAIAFKAENLKKFFYKLPLILISIVGTLVMLAVGGITMAIPVVPVWLGIVVCVIVLAFTAIAVIGAVFAADTVSDIDGKIADNTIFIKTLASDAEVLISKVSVEDTKAVVKNIYDIVRYSDPVSSAQLKDLESQITIKYEEFRESVLSGSVDTVLIAEALAGLLRERNAKCKLLKKGI